MSATAEVFLWGTRIGAVSQPDGQRHAAFQYDPVFVDSGIEVAPLRMPLSRGVYTFPELPLASFHGLPGLLADSLPDRYGNALIDAWLASQGRRPASFGAVERLCYTGARGMGALEFRPVTGPRPTTSTPLHVDALVALASEVLANRRHLRASLAGTAKSNALRDILRVGTSAGGARAKAVIAWNPATNEVRSGQLPADPGFQHWLLKFDGVTNNRDKELADPKGYGALEYAYAGLARAAGLVMTDCRLLEEGGRRHFMTRRFDRTDDGDKRHMQSLAALDHLDFNDPRAHSYEAAFVVLRRLGLPMDDAEQLYRRMVFNVVARNQDDHVKNIAFLMDRRGRWRLAPAFDVTWKFNPDGAWTAQHQMSVNGKRDGFTRADLAAVARVASLNTRRARAVVDEVIAAVAGFRNHADAAGVPRKWAAEVAATHRLDLPTR